MPAMILKMDANFCYVAIPDPASGRRRRYTLYRIELWGRKIAHVFGRELSLKEARRIVDQA